MVGGQVIEVAGIKDRPDVLFVDCREKGKLCEANTCAVLVERNETSERIEIGDQVWWQCGYVYWTPRSSRVTDEEAEKRGLKCGVDYDIKIPKVGYSGVKHPSRQDNRIHHNQSREQNMKASEFCYWLQGFFEVTQAAEAAPITITADQSKVIQQHLSLVFKHELDKLHGTLEEQAELQKIHDEGKSLALPDQNDAPEGTLFRC